MCGALVGTRTGKLVYTGVWMGDPGHENQDGTVRGGNCEGSTRDRDW